jgi:hypothetical protein
LAQQRVSVTLEKPHRGGALLLRCGTEPATKNPNYDANRPQMGPMFIKGDPIVYGPLFANDAAKASVQMDENVAKDLFGDWDAPDEEVPGQRHGYVKWVEKERLKMMWGGPKYPKGNGTMHPDMTEIGPADIPHVAVRFVDSRGNVSEDRVIRPRAHFGIDDAVYEKTAEMRALMKSQKQAVK